MQPLTLRCVFLLFVGAIAGSALADEPREVVVFERRTEGYDTFRIPAVIASAKGTLLAFCEGRTKNGGDSGDIDLVLKRSKDGGKTWGPLQRIVDAGPDTVGNPCPVLDRDTERIWLPLSRNDGDNTIEQNKRSTGQGAREVLLCHSDDDGATWSEPANITAAVKRDGWTWYATGPGCGIQLKDGRLVIPCNHRLPGKPDPNSIAHVIVSDDHGKSWQIGGASEEQTNESQVVELDDGGLLLNMRSHHGRNRRAIAKSADRGQTWSPVTFDETLLEPTCQASILRLPAGKDGKTRIVFANPASLKREKMTIRLSSDNAQTWPISKELYAGPSGYSSLVALPNGQIGCFYEKDGYKQLVFVSFGIDWLEGK